VALKIMVRTLITLIFLSVLLSCSNEKSPDGNKAYQSIATEQTDAAQSADTVSRPSKTDEPAPATEFLIRDPSKYSADFISEFKKSHSGYQTVTLADDTIVINNDYKDFIIIPTDLSLATAILYEAQKDGKIFKLTVKRINVSTIEYNYSETADGKTLNDQNGKADLEPVFYFGAEGTFEDFDGQTYGMNEYIDNSVEGCWTYIYVGVGSINKSFLKHGCETDKEKVSTPELIIKK
jgi:hypothetical protein